MSGKQGTGHRAQSTGIRIRASARPRVRVPFLRGDVLPLALIILATIVIGAFTFGFVILQGLLRTRDLDASTVAYYAADAGVERQLYAVRKENANVASLGSMGAAYANGSSWAAAGSGFKTTNAKFFSSINDGDFQFVDLFNPDSLNSASGISLVKWTWTGPALCQLEVAFAQWDVSQPSILPSQFTIQESLGGSGSQGIDPTHAYRFRFRPKGCSVTNVSVMVYASPWDVTPVPFPGDITVAAQGSYAKTTQAISVTMPRLEILSGIFSYVIFSECTLFKDPTGSAPACP
jgi:hypothetical protein